MQRLAVWCRLGVLRCTEDLHTTSQRTSDALRVAHRLSSLRETHFLSSNPRVNGTFINSKSHSNLYSKLFMQPSRQKGHAKWQNIRHIKAANEEKMKILTERMLRAVSAAIKENNGETNPDFNPRLRHILQNAQSQSVPKAVLLKHIKAAAENAKNAKQFFIECRGPFGSAMIIDAMAVKQAKAKNEIQSVLKKYGASLKNITSVKMLFDHKGIIEACIQDGQEEMSQDKMDEIAIEAGAEDVEMLSNSGTKTIFQFTCDPQDFGVVRKSIEDQGLHIIGSYLGYVPNSYVDTPKEAVETISEFIEKLEEFDEIIRVYDNFKLPS